MRKIILLSFMAAVSLMGTAQTQLENPGFEDWQNVGSPTEEPTNWSSLKTSDDGFLSSFAPQVCWREATNPHSGSYCLKMENIYVSFPGVTANGIVTNGQVHASTDPEQGYVFTKTSDAAYNTACTNRPDSLVGWFRYSPATGDQGKVEVILHDAPPQGQLPAANYPEAHWIGRARYDITTNSPSTWVRFAVPFTYYNTNSPDYILAVLTSGDSTQAVDGSILWLDDMALIYNPNLVSVTPPAPQNIDMGVNGTMLTVNSTPNAAVVTPVTQEWKYTTTSGSGYTSFGTPETGTTYTPNFAAAGIYYVVCEVDFGTEVITSNEVEIVVTDPASNSVTISPSAPQTILVGDNGTLMTATESPAAASSREWKFSTVSGSGYASFGTPVTGLTYTPNFAAVGTYYVICESDFAGDVQLSNEVTIMVPSAAGIDEADLKFNIFNNGNALVVRLSDLQPNATLTLFSVDGKMVYSSAITEENSLHNIEAKGVFVYHVVTGDKIITGKINL